MINLSLQLAIIVALTLLNSFFAMSETALVSSRKERLRQRAEAGDRGVAETGLLDRCRVVGDPRALPAVIGLPDSVRACLFDLDGVLTRTATVHSAAWKEMFDGYLRERAARRGERFVPFDPVADYAEYVDGKPRYDGVRSFLAVRGIELPDGEPGDPPDAETVCGLGNRKNEIVLRMIREGGVEAYEGSVRYLEAAREAGLRRAVVSSSANTLDVLLAAGIEGFFQARIDGVVAEREGLKGKPAPDTFLAGARALGVAPDRAAVFEDALAGVAAGRAGGFACVVGVDRAGQAGVLREHGASIVVSDLSELLEDR
jgi:beta-phosphoglucomutase family hydrolase